MFTLYHDKVSGGGKRNFFVVMNVALKVSPLKILLTGLIKGLIMIKCTVDDSCAKHMKIYR